MYIQAYIHAKNTWVRVLKQKNQPTNIYLQTNTHIHMDTHIYE